MKGYIRRFLVFCSGASQSILARCPESEMIKLTGLGGTILFTTLFAMISSHYALYLVTGNVLLSWVGGILWGLMIFNLDRYLISSMRRLDTNLYVAALPRIILGFLIAFTLAHPVELKLFESEIDEYLNTMNVRQKEDINQRYLTQISTLENNKKSDLAQASVSNELETKLSQLDQYMSRRLDLDDITSQSQQQYLCECDGTCGTGHAGRGAECERKEIIYQENNARLDSLNRVINTLQSRVSQLQSSASNELTRVNQTYTDKIDRLTQLQYADIDKHEVVFSDSLYSRSRAFYLLVEEDGLETFVLFIFMLFLMVELAPMIAKLMQPVGAYDIVLSTEKIKAEKVNDEMVKTIDTLDLSKERERYTRSIQVALSKILHRWFEDLDEQQYSNRLNGYFDHIYSSFIQHDRPFSDSQMIAISDTSQQIPLRHQYVQDKPRQTRSKHIGTSTRRASSAPVKRGFGFMGYAMAVILLVGASSVVVVSNQWNMSEVLSLKDNLVTRFQSMSQALIAKKSEEYQYMYAQVSQVIPESSVSAPLKVQATVAMSQAQKITQILSASNAYLSSNTLNPTRHTQLSAQLNQYFDLKDLTLKQNKSLFVKISQLNDRLIQYTAQLLKAGQLKQGLSYLKMANSERRMTRKQREQLQMLLSQTQRLSQL